MSIADEIVQRDPTAGYSIRLDLRDPMGRVTNSRWLSVPASWLYDLTTRARTDFGLLSKQAISDAGSLNGVPSKGSNE